MTMTQLERPGGSPTASGLKNKIETSYLTDEERWEAVMHREKNADDAFVYSVKTTGVYCRPSCPARRPRQANVRYYDDPNGAEQEGFRACRRCKPRGDAQDGERLCRRLTAGWPAPRTDWRDWLGSVSEGPP